MNMTTVPEQKYQINFPGMRNLIRDPNLSCQEKILALNLVMYAGVDGKCFPSQKTLGEDLSFSSRYISTLLAGLKDRGIITTKRRGYSKSLNYSLTPLLLLELQKEDRNTSSSHIGSIVPLHIGTTVLPKERSKEINVSSKALQLFQVHSFKGKDSRENKVVTALVGKYGDAMVSRAVEASCAHTKGKFNSSYLGKKLQDWYENGEPEVILPKPTFKSCGNCDGGYKQVGTGFNIVAHECECRVKWQEAVKRWEEGAS